MMNGEHREAEKLTAGSTVVVAASGRAPKRVIDGGRDLEREREGTGECKSDQNVTKN